MMKQTMRKWVGVTLCLSLFFSMFSSVSGTAKKAAKIKKIEVRTTDSGVLVMKKKERKTLKLAINGKVSKTAWKRLKFRSKNKKAVKVNKKGKLTAKKKGSSKITITAKGSKKKTVLKVIVGTKVKSISMNATAYTLVEGGTVQLSAAVAPQKASYKKIRWSSSDTGVAVVTNGQVRAVKAGTATITAMSMDGTKKKAVCRIVVEKAGGSSSFPSVTPTVTVTGQPTESATATSTTTASGQPTESATATSTTTASGQPTESATATSTTTASGQPTESATATSTTTASGQPTATSTASGQPTATSTATASGRPTATATSTTTASGQPTATATSTTTASGQPTSTATATPTATSTSKPETLLVKKCTDMAASGLTGTMEEPFKGVKLYTDGDAITTTYDFKGTNKKYRMILKGASTNNTAAGISLYIGGKKKGAVWFTGDKLSEQTIDFKMQEEETGSLEIMLKLETDNGSNDTCLESFELIFLADIPAPPEAPVPVGGAVKTGQYRNMFKELGYSEKEINAKVEEAWDKFFYGTEDERIYYPVGNDMAYIYTADTNDVRSEGMSYGMMICVQMDKQEEFNRLWKWAKTYMHHKDGERKGYFAWQCGTDGSKKDQNPAPDGEEYFVTSLFFASARWGDGDGIYDYKAQAQEILDDIMSRNDSGGGVVNMFNSSHKMVVFVPYGNSALYTDPSYHLPAFYEVWAELADKNNEFWREAAQVSRAYFKKATNATTGLGPDYSEFSGEPKREGNHGDFRFDAWRIAGNIACDYAWWGKDNWATTHADRIQAFFAKQGVESYKNQYAVDGKELEGDHSPGLVAMNATASLAASDKKAWAFLEDFWNISPTTGKYRYYDGCLYMMGLLHCSGRFRAWLPDGTTPSVTASGQPTATPTATASGRPTATPTATTTASGQPTATATATPTATPTATASGQPTATPTATSTSKPETLLVKKCTDMAASGLTGTMEEPFKGVKLYTDGDAITTTYDFKGTNKKYRMILKGASTNNTAAGISLYIGGKKKGAVWFTGDKLSEQTIDFKMQEEETGSLEIMLKLETDNGSNDTCLESFELIFLADIPAPPEAPVPVGGAVKTGQYRNMFKELGYSEKEINAKVEEAWDKFFYGTEDERIYYPVGNDMAYIYTADTNDVRSEGMSYGMMICVQMDKQEEFNRLWKWAKTYMHHKDGERKGYFAWQCGTDGSKKDQNPAPDGEEYFVTSLFFASARWGDGDGIYDYKAQAQEILDDIMSRNDSGGGVVNMFNSSHKMVVFVPYGNSALYTDPSYHLPAFYEVWAELADKNNEFWREAAQVSRAYFKKATNATTGLGPDYSEFSGEPKREGNHGDFRFDAWRIAGNIACDYAWWGKDNWATTHADRIQAFFAKQGVESYKNQYAVDGKELEGDHSPGLVAMNATASLAASDKKAWAFLEDFWNISPTTGKYRYYDGCLYMMGLLHCSGRFRAWLPDGTTPSVSSTIAADSTEFDKETAKQKPIHVTMTLNGNTLTKIQNEGNALVQDKDYTIQGDVVTIKKEYLAAQKTGKISLYFVFSAGRKAVLSVAIKDTTPGVVPDVGNPFEQIQATAFSDSKDVTVKDGIVTLNSAGSYIAFELDFDANVQETVIYASGGSYGTSVSVSWDTLDKNPQTIWNIPHLPTFEEKNAVTNIPSGKHTVYLKTSNPNLQIKWVKFTKQ